MTDVEDLIPLAELNRREQRQKRFQRVREQGRHVQNANIPENKNFHGESTSAEGSAYRFFPGLVWRLLD